MPNAPDDKTVKIKLAMAGELLIELAGMMVYAPNHIPSPVYRSMARLKLMDALSALDVLDEVAVGASWKVIDADSPTGP